VLRVPEPDPGGRPGLIGPASLSAVVAGWGLLMMVVGLQAPEPPPQPSAAGSVTRYGPTRNPLPRSTGGPVTTRADAALPPSGGLARSRPLRLEIPRIAIRTPLLDLGLHPDGSMVLPPLTSDAPAGWYRYLASPGENGPAVIVGHVDSARDGPAVFYRLGSVRPGDLVVVLRADGVLARFVVTRVISVRKNRFPDDDVFGPVDYPALRLITCGGPFDRGTGHYLNNVIVFARLTGTSIPAGHQ
jgi:hypothetical protein